MNEIETQRLQLRLFRPNDLDKLSQIFSDPEVVRYLGTGKPALRTETEKALNSIIRHWDIHGFGRWAAVLKKTQELIGYCGLRSFNGTPELVYLLSKQYWGMGLATEMARESLKYGFEKRNFERIIAMAKLDNVASQNVMRKIGMSFQKNATIFNIDVVFYSISRETYLSEQAKNILEFKSYLGPTETCGDLNYNENTIPHLPSSSELEAKTVSVETFT